MYAVQVNTNERSDPSKTKFIGRIFGDTITEAAEKLEYPDTEAVSEWMKKNAGNVEKYLAAHPDETYFLGDNGKYRFDAQLADGRGA